MSNTSILAQAPGTSSPAIDGPPTIEIDPDQVPGIEIVTGEVVEPEVEVKGAVGEALEDFVPESGIDSVDGAVNTLTDAVGGATGLSETCRSSSSRSWSSWRRRSSPGWRTRSPAG